MSTMAFQITHITIVYSTNCSDTDKKNIKTPRHRLVRQIHRWLPAQTSSKTKNVSIWWRYHGSNMIGVCMKWSCGYVVFLVIPTDHTNLADRLINHHDMYLSVSPFTYELFWETYMLPDRYQEHSKLCARVQCWRIPTIKRNPTKDVYAGNAFLTIRVRLKSHTMGES